MDDYLLGVDVLGAIEAEILGAGLPASNQGPFVTIHVRDVAGLVKAKGGATGAMVYGLAPQTIENKVYGDMATKMASGLKEQGVDADVQVVTNKPAGGPLHSDFLIGGLVGAGGVGIVYGVVKLVRYFIGRSK